MEETRQQWQSTRFLSISRFSFLNEHISKMFTLSQAHDLRSDICNIPLVFHRRISLDSGEGAGADAAGEQQKTREQTAEEKCKHVRFDRSAGEKCWNRSRRRCFTNRYSYTQKHFCGIFQVKPDYFVVYFKILFIYFAFSQVFHKIIVFFVFQCFFFILCAISGLFFGCTHI